MNTGRLTAIASGFAVAALGLSLGLPGSAGAATTSAAASRASAVAAAPRYVVLNCMEKDKAQVKPGTIYLACADDGIGVAHLHWTSWTSELASAYGTAWVNDCKPNCAAGHIHHYPVIVALWGSAVVKGHPALRRYTEATLGFKKGNPAGFVKSRLYPGEPVSVTLSLVA